MRIGLLIAIERELKAFLESGAEITEEVFRGRTIYRARMGEHEVFALCSGCGEIDASAGTMLLIAKYEVEQVWNFGVTGALEPSLRVEDLFVVRRVRHYDFDTSPFDPVKPNQYVEFPDEFIPLDEGLLARAKAVAPGLREATVASGDKFVEDRAVKRELNGLGCDICDMEIAAIARTCWKSGVPCLSIKCISDAYDGDGSDFAANVERSAQSAFRVLRALME